MLDDSSKELRHMVSDETLLNYTDWKVPFNVHTDASDKQLGAITSQNNKPIDIFINNINLARTRLH